jgi:hypothetical protein
MKFQKKIVLIDLEVQALRQQFCVLDATHFVARSWELIDSAFIPNHHFRKMGFGLGECGTS